MLKFLRKYQLIFLAIGGSLLMIVFLLQPVIRSFQRSQLNRAVGRYADGSKITAVDYDKANAELEIAKRVARIVFAPKNQGGLGLSMEDGDSEQRVHHWIMLSRMAEDAGLVGGAEDGHALIERQLAVEMQYIYQQGQMAVMMGQMTREDFQNQFAQFESVRRTQIDREISSAQYSMRGATPDDVWRLLAKFTGAYRLLELYYTTPAFSPAGARAGVRDMNDAIAVNAGVVSGSTLASRVPDPTDEQLRAFFDARAGLTADADEYGIGYVQPGRVQLAWLVLDRSTFETRVEIDRVELRKIWEQDSQKPADQRQYPGDFASERSNIEAVYRKDKADALMVEADRVIRAEVLRATRTLQKKGEAYVLPENWAQTRPSLESLAEAVVTRLGEQGVTMPTPTVRSESTQWLGSQELSQLDGVGQAWYRVGSKTVSVSQIPDDLDANGVMHSVGLQAAIPQVDPAAQDTAGSRYYLVVTAFRPAGPAHSIEEIGRDRVLADYKAVEGYKLLTAMTDRLTEAAKGSDGVRGAIDIALDGLDMSTVTRPGVFPNVRVSSLRIDPGPLARGVNPAINQPAFRDAVVAAAEGVDPLAAPESLDSEPRAVAVPLPKARSVAIARLVAPRPFTREQFMSNFTRSLAELGGSSMANAIKESGSSDPFTFEALEQRYGLKPVGKGRNNDAG